MPHLFTTIRRSTILRTIIAVILCISAALIDHAMFTILHWSLLLTWQVFAFIFLLRPTINPLLLTSVGIIFDTLSGMTIGYTAILLILLQIITILFQDFFRALPDISKSLFMAFLLLFMMLPEWLLSCAMLQEFTSIMPLLPTRLPCVCTFPIFYMTLRYLKTLLSTYESAQS